MSGEGRESEGCGKNLLAASSASNFNCKLAATVCTIRGAGGSV
jgi:hypothetical protein